MAKLDAVFKSNLTLQRTVEYGTGTFNDSRTALQNYESVNITRYYRSVRMVDSYMCGEDLIVIHHCECNRLLKFVINPLGIYKVSTLSVFGGNNSPVNQINLPFRLISHDNKAKKRLKKAAKRISKKRKLLRYVSRNKRCSQRSLQLS